MVTKKILLNLPKINFNSYGSNRTKIIQKQIFNKS